MTQLTVAPAVRQRLADRAYNKALAALMTDEYGTLTVNQVRALAELSRSAVLDLLATTGSNEPPTE